MLDQINRPTLKRMSDSAQPIAFGHNIQRKPVVSTTSAEQEFICLLQEGNRILNSQPDELRKDQIISLSRIRSN